MIIASLSNTAFVRCVRSEQKNCQSFTEYEWTHLNVDYLIRFYSMTCEHGVLYYRPRQRYSDFEFTTFPMITEIGLLRMSLYTIMKYFLQGVEKIWTGLPGNLRYFRFHFKSLITRQLIIFRSHYWICIKILAMLMLSPNLV